MSHSTVFIAVDVAVVLLCFCTKKDKVKLPKKSPNYSEVSGGIANCLYHFSPIMFLSCFRFAPV